MTTQTRFVRIFLGMPAVGLVLGILIPGPDRVGRIASDRLDRDTASTAPDEASAARPDGVQGPTDAIAALANVSDATAASPGPRTSGEPDDSSADPTGGTASDPFPGAFLLAQKDEPAGADGTVRRVRVVLAPDFKYPHVRIEETWRPDPRNGELRPVRRRSMVADHVLVKLRPGPTESDLSAVSERHGFTLRAVIDAGSGLFLLGLPGHGPDDLPLARAALRGEPATVAFAEPDTLLHASVIPGDPRFGELWGMHNAGDHDIDATEAWDRGRGHRAIRVGVVDTGVDAGHPDLAGNIAVNAGEVEGNGVDDDGNGYVDDVRGWDFYANDNDPGDPNGHGTHVAGTIGATGDNGTGVVGVNWVVGIVPLRFMSASGSGATSDAVRAIAYATRNGIPISNHSWGGGGASAALRDAITEAGRAGHLLVCAAGNDGRDADVSGDYLPGYPQGNLISVAASDRNDDRASFSNWGRTTVDLAAPGAGILSTVPRSLDAEVPYDVYSGTSMATPHVSGAAALLKAYRPDFTMEQLKGCLLASVDLKSQWTNLVGSGGRLNANRALLDAAAAPAGLVAVRVTATSMNVRSLPGTSGAILGKAASGQIYLSAAKTSGGWVQVWHEGRTAYLWGGYTTRATGVTEAVVWSATANVRSGPGTTNAVIGRANGFEHYHVETTSGNWARIRWSGGRAGWVSESMLRKRSL